MPKLDISSAELIARLLGQSRRGRAAILDSCGIGHLGSKLLVAGIDPLETTELSGLDVNERLTSLTLAVEGELPCIFTLSYEFGLLLNGIRPQHASTAEPHLFVSRFKNLIVHNYATRTTHVLGVDPQQLVERLSDPSDLSPSEITRDAKLLSSSFSKSEYLAAVGEVQEEIRSGNTYQANIVQKFTVELGELDPQTVFGRLRRDHPAAFAAFVQRPNSTIVSASPERFFRIADGVIEASPIKGTAPRVDDETIDSKTRETLLHSRKDNAENTMIVDLLRNDLGRVCNYGSVEVTKLCDLEEHPTLFHLVSTIKGKLKQNAGFADVIRALFPCGSITGAPKISTMKIIDRVEKAARGLSMGAIGYSIPTGFETEDSGLTSGIDTNVAIRTMVIRDGVASFSTGGGIVSDSRPDLEYSEMLLKAKALFAALGVDPNEFF